VETVEIRSGVRSYEGVMRRVPVPGLAAAALLAGCGPQQRADPPPPPLAQTVLAPADSSRAGLAVPQDRGPPAELLRRAAGRAVHADSPNARVLYSWTTAEQLADLRKGKKLLLRSESPTKGRALFDGKLDQVRSNTGSGIAALFQRSPLDKRRFAFPNAFATSLGLKGESYGDVLVEIRFREDAWIAIVGPFSISAFLDMNGKTVPVATAQKEPGRIAGALHVDTNFREIVVFNEAAVERWSACTPEIARSVRDEMEFLRKAASFTPDALPPPPPPAGRFEVRSLPQNEVWPKKPEGAASLDQLLLAAMASTEAPYALTSGALEKLAASLERATRCASEGVVVEPKLAYPKLVVPPQNFFVQPPPPPRRFPRGTFL